ncbi:unnamed protein product [Amoebophrya sp. A120]|nr:unnamed protein product [Amoebophrya sp. A120]|eukprot:GSA120T00013790001.1
MLKAESHIEAVLCSWSDISSGTHLYFSIYGAGARGKIL